MMLMVEFNVGYVCTGERETGMKRKNENQNYHVVFCIRRTSLLKADLPIYISTQLNFCGWFGLLHSIRYIFSLILFHHSLFYYLSKGTRCGCVCNGKFPQSNRRQSRR